MWDTIVTILVILSGIAMLWAISQLAWAVIEAETKKQLIQRLRTFYALISPAQADIQSPWRGIDFRTQFNDGFNVELIRMRQRP